MFKTIGLATILASVLALKAPVATSTGSDYQVTTGARVTASQLIPELEGALGLKLSGVGQDGYVEITEGDPTTVRVVLLSRKLDVSQQARIADTVAAHVVQPVGELRGPRAAAMRARKAEFQKRYAGASSDAERVQIMAEFLGLQSK